jgi:4-amino-4-deoxy-L-arabinose transferase-like glycosyltransferase
MPGSHLLTPQVVILYVDLALLAVLGVFRLATWRTARRIVPDLPGGLAVFLLALLLRLLLSPHAVVHENAHGYEYLRSAFSLEGYFYHGSGYYAFFHLLTGVFGRRPEVIFCTNALLGAGSALLLVSLGRRLLDSREAAWLAAVLYACWPVALRVGGSESMFPLAVLSGLLAWRAWLSAWDRGGAVRFLLAAGLCAFCVQVRPVMLLWPAVLLLSLPLCRGWTRRLKTPGPWIGLALFLGLVSVWFLFRVRVAAAEGVPGLLRLAPGEFLSALVSSSNLLWRFEWTPSLTWLLSGVGIVLLLARRRRAAPALLLGYLVVALMVIGIGLEPSALRLQNPLQPFLVLWVGLGAAGIADRLGPRWRRGSLVLLGALMAAACLSRAPQVARAYNPQIEYAFFKRTVPALEKDCAVITADRCMAGRILWSEYPVWWARAAVEEQSRHLEDPDNVSGWPCRLFYRGITCYQFISEELDAVPPDGMRPDCRRIEEHYDLIPLIEKRFLSRPYPDFHVPAKSVTIGFYRMIPKRRAQ